MKNNLFQYNIDCHLPRTLCQNVSAFSFQFLKLCLSLCVAPLPLSLFYSIHSSLSLSLPFSFSTNFKEQKNETLNKCYSFKCLFNIFFQIIFNFQNTFLDLLAMTDTTPSSELTCQKRGFQKKKNLIKNYC